VDRLYIEALVEICDELAVLLDQDHVVAVAGKLLSQSRPHQPAANDDYLHGSRSSVFFISPR